MADSTGVTDREWESWRTFMSMRRELEVALERQLQRDAKISMAEYGVLLTLFESPDRQLRGNELGRALSWEKSRVSHQVSRMEKKGLVERRECDTDARGTWIAITADGKRAVLGVMREHSATLRSLFFDVVTPAELDAINAASQRVLDIVSPVNCGVAEASD